MALKRECPAALTSLGPKARIPAHVHLAASLSLLHSARGLPGTQPIWPSSSQAQDLRNLSVRPGGERLGGGQDG